MGYTEKSYQKAQNLPKNQLLKNLHERFLHLAQEILCDSSATAQVAETTLEKVKQQYGEKCRRPITGQSFVEWTQALLDAEIENYFQHMLNEIRATSRETKNRLIKMLTKRFEKCAQNKAKYDWEYINEEDVKDIIQDAIAVVSNRCLDAEPKGTFIQWAQMILKNKYREHKSTNMKKKMREERLTQEEYQMGHNKRLSDVVKKRSTKEADPEEATRMRKQYPENDKADPFEADVYRFQPDSVTESEDLKKQLLSLIPEIREKCKKVFRVLFSEGDRKFMHDQFPNMTSSQIDLLISQCRNQLKTLAIKRGIL